MSKKQVEGQQSLDSFLTPSAPHPQPIWNKLKEQDTPEIELNPKKRMPPSVENQTKKKINREASPNQAEPQSHLFQSEILDMAGKENSENNSIPNELIKPSSEEAEEPLLRKTIDCMKITMQELINQLEEKINQLIGTKERQDQQEDKVIKMKIKQSELYRKCKKIEIENTKLKKRIELLENKMLKVNLIIHGLREEEWEDETSRRERVYHAIAPTVDADDRTERLHTARSIPIRSTTRLGKYKQGKNRPISIQFEKKSHADILYSSKSWLPKGVYVDREYMWCATTLSPLSR